MLSSTGKSLSTTTSSTYGSVVAATVGASEWESSAPSIQQPTTQPPSLTEVVGMGRMGSQFMRLLQLCNNDCDSVQQHQTLPPPIAVPRGVCPGSLSLNDGTPIFICTPTSQWESLYESTVLHRRSDLVFVGNGLWKSDSSTASASSVAPSTASSSSVLFPWSDVTIVIPHYAILEIGSRPSFTSSTSSQSSTNPTNDDRPQATKLPQQPLVPTYIAGKHATTVQRLLHLDEIPTTILSDTSTVIVKAAQKLLWSSCLWLLCHHTTTTSPQESPKPPLTVSQVHTDRKADLEKLVRELWPSFSRRVLLEQQSGGCDSSALQHPTWTETLDYMERYSNSIPTAIPSLQLAVSELPDRNGIFADPTQTFHRYLIEQIVGPSGTTIFEAATRKQNEPPENERRMVDLRATVGLSVYGHAMSVSCPTHRHQLQHPKNVVIVGAGIMGCSLALNLARLRSNDDGNTFITVVDCGHDATDMQPTTIASWGWLNANQKSPPYYQQLNCLGMHAWHRDPLLCALPVWSGSLVRYEQESLPPSWTTTAGFYGQPVGPLAPNQWLTLDANVNFASTETDPIPAVYSFPNEGHVDPSDAVRVLRQGAQDMGVTFLWNHTVTSVLYDDDDDNNIVGSVVGVEIQRTADDCPDISTPRTTTLSANLVIVAAGVGSAHAKLGGLPMLHRPGKLAFHTPDPRSPRLSRIVVDTVRKSHVLQRRDGTVVEGGGPLEVGGVDVAKVGAQTGAALVVDDTGGPSQDRITPSAGAMGLIPAVLNATTFTTTTQAVRPMPLDGLPAVGYIRPGLYSFVTHSGVTLAPLLGALAAAEIMNRMELDLLAKYRPSRFNL